jgi:hypothetical protein
MPDISETQAPFAAQPGLAEPIALLLRLMGVESLGHRRPVRLLGLAALAVWPLAGCLDDPASLSENPDCVSAYYYVATADTKPQLHQKLRNEVHTRRPVAFIRTVGPVPERSATAVVLLDADGKRLRYLEIGQFGDDRWFAGNWGECTD